MLGLIILLYVAATVGGLVALKLGSANGSPITLKNKKVSYTLNRAIVLGIFMYIVSFLLYTYLIAKYDLGYIIPLAAAFVYITLFAASYFIFKETFTKNKLMGVALIVLGVLLLNMHGLS